jgi:uncharacterized protein (TIGR03066 family)
MNPPRLLGALVLVFATATAAQPDDKKDKDKKDKPDYAKLIVGKWEITKTDFGKGLTGSVVEFRQDGTMKSTVKTDGKQEELFASYKVEGDKLHITRTLPTPKGPKPTEEETCTTTIKKLTETELIIDEGKDRVGKDRTTECKRLK